MTETAKKRKEIAVAKNVSSQEIQVEYADGDRMLNLSVNPNDSLYQEATCSEEEGFEVQDAQTKSEPDSDVSEGKNEISQNSPDTELGEITDEDQHVQKQIDKIDETMIEKVQNLHQEMTKQGMHKAADLLKDCFSPEDSRAGKIYNTNGMLQQPPKRLRFVDDRNKNQNSRVKSNMLEEMIYENTVQKRNSSSSEDNLDLSDETLNNDLFHLTGYPSEKGMPQGRQTTKETPVKTARELTPEARADDVIRQAEAAKARILPTTGELGTPKEFQFIAKIDEDYQLVGSHINQITHDKIIRGDYVDFGKLLPKDRVMSDETERLELVVKQGRTFWSPVSEVISINGYSKWEQAFCIYSDIYTRQYPDRSSELIQYNHIIHSTSTVYAWDNVYSYDKEFRTHLRKHPERSWVVILQQAWSMYLKDRLLKSDNHGFTGYHNSHHSPKPSGVMSGNFGNVKSKINEPCRCYNKGHCKFGTSCNFEHRCSYCFKFGHYVLICCKLAADRENNQKGKNATPMGARDAKD